MTKKDYEKIAMALRASAPIALSETGRMQMAQYQLSVGKIASALAADNPHFDRVRFMNACGIE